MESVKDKNYSYVEAKIKEKGYTKTEFAEKLGITRFGLYKKLKGERPITKLEKEKIEELLGVKVD